MLKRAFDVVTASLSLLLLSPLFLAAAVAIMAGSPGPAFYRGVRVGRGGRPFRIFKFRTMVVDADRIGGASTADDDARITRVGAFLRRHKLDELPQLLNVVLGDMSLVGPRPQVPADVARYTPEEKLLLSMRPGITDYASLRFRNEGEILLGHPDPDEAYDRLIRPEKIQLGLEYVRTHSFLVDLRILIRTAMATFGTGPSNLPRENRKQS